MTTNNANDFELAHGPATAASAPTFEADPGMRPISMGSLPPAAVTNLDIDVTEACNLGCVYCFKSELYARHMTLETMKRAFDWLVAASRNASSVNCNFMGGEPTMRWREIRTFCIWARRRGAQIGKKVTFSMTSNLTIWTREIREFVDAYGFGVLMSIDGCPEVQDGQRPSKNGKSNSSVVEKWARSLLKTRPRSTARSTLNPDYVGWFFRSVRYLHQIGFGEVTVSAADYDRWSPEHFLELEEQCNAVVAYMLERLETKRPLMITVLSYYVKKLVALRRSGRPDDVQFMKQPCGAGKGYMMIDYTGDVWPCHRFDGADTDAGANGQFRLANIFEPGFNKRLHRAFLDFDHGANHKESCVTCPVNPVCGGYCPAANLSSTGSIYTPHDAFCAWSQLMYKVAERLYDGASAAGESALSALMRQVETVDTDGR